MALKITLKPDEKMIVGAAVVSNGNSNNIHLIIENNVPVLRQKHILSKKKATSPCSQLYFLIQLMYIDEENLIIQQHTYWDLVHKILNTVPRSLGHIDRINEDILCGRYYHALKMASELIEYEQEILQNASTDPIT
jgi:flagellar protein FlbT